MAKLERKQLKTVKVEVSDAYTKIQNYFFDFPTKEFSLNDLCLAVGISKTTAKMVVERLIRESFLRKQEIGKLWRLSTDLKHPYHITRKIPYHLHLVYETGLIEFIHERIPSTKAIILFGSYRKGDDDEHSDLDIAVEVIENIYFFAAGDVVNIDGKEIKLVDVSLDGSHITVSVNGLSEKISKNGIINGFGIKKQDVFTSDNADERSATIIVGDTPLQIMELGIIKKLGERSNVPVRAHIFSRSNVNINLFANIANGIILDGFLEVKPFLDESTEE